MSAGRTRPDSWPAAPAPESSACRYRLRMSSRRSEHCYSKRIPGRNPAQSSRRPSTPLASSAVRLLSSIPEEEQLEATDGSRVSPRIWIGYPATVAWGTAEAVSPAIWFVARDTDPEVKPLTNWLHSPMRVPPLSSCSGKAVGPNSPPAGPARGGASQPSRHRPKRDQ